MLKRCSAFITVAQAAIDIVIVAATWIAVYFIRFHLNIFSVTKGIPQFGKHLQLTVPIVAICFLGFIWAGLYRSKRAVNLLKQFVDILKACALSALLILAFLYYSQQEFYSRMLQGLFVLILFLGMCISHLAIIQLLRQLRKRGYNLRYYVVIGTGKKAQLLVRDIEKTAWLGLKCGFFVDNNPNRIGSNLMGVPVYGPFDKLTELVQNRDIDEVYLALSGDQAQAAYPALETLQEKGVTVRIIPDWGNLASISAATTVTIGSQVLFSAADSPLSGMNIILKEAFDRAVALVLLVILAVPFCVIALMIKLTSKGPVFYKQVRVGLDQKQFRIIKFRTMKVNAEPENAPRWTKPRDPRCTRFGRWLRSTSIDELPQLINVLKGQMSLVGPRPERPSFVKQFSEEYKKYMLRHKIKAGMTGWAQVHGFRGDTSLKKRLQYDLYYIRNWSFALDIRTLLLTPWHLLKRKNAY